ncbi:MAG: hypothetical protein NTY01_17295 [Verrucomicrobia bacterium]|nr:hypothetical protein [Verrucomicrobiota bacterium]
MKRLSAVFGVLLLATCGASHSRAAAAAGPMQQAIAALPNDADVRIIYTDVLGDKKSVRNDLQVSPERTFHLILRETKLAPAAKTKQTPLVTAQAQDRWQLLIHAREWNGQEALESGSAAEKKLIWLLRRRIAATTDAAEKQNASTLAEALMSRSQSYPAPGSGRWALRSAALTKKP